MINGLKSFLQRHDLSQAWLARRINMEPSTLARKVAGNRPITRDEINAILGVAQQLDPGATYERLFSEVRYE